MSFHGKIPLFVIALSLSLASACAEENTNPGGNTPLPTACTATQQGNLRCNGLDVQECNGAAWATTTTCTGQRCVTTSSTTAECQDEVIPTCTSTQNGHQRCNGLDVEDCDGTDWATSDTCTGNEVCVLTGLSAECVDNTGTDATEFNGFWLYQSMTRDATTYTRGNTSHGLIGDVTFASTSTTTAAMDYRFGTIENDATIASAMGISAAPFLQDEPQFGESSFVLEGRLWVITEGSSVTVFNSTLAGNTLTLTYDATDARNTETDVPSQMVLTRATPWSTETVGDWDMISMRVPVQPLLIETGECIFLDTSFQNWGKLYVPISISDRHIMYREQRGDYFTGSNCFLGTPVVVDELIDTGIGIIEEEGGVARYWEWRTDIYAGGGATNAYTMEFDVSKDGDEMTFTRTSCIASDSYTYTDNDGTFFRDGCDYFPTIITMGPVQ